MSTSTTAQNVNIEQPVRWTDCIPSRAEPLDREVKLAPDEAEAHKIADELVKENIKRRLGESGVGFSRVMFLTPFPRNVIA